jgi:hypothetical protein
MIYITRAYQELAMRVAGGVTVSPFASRRLWSKPSSSRKVTQWNVRVSLSPIFS